MENMWRKRNFCTQLVRTQFGAVTTEHSVTVPQKAKNRTMIRPNNSTPGYTISAFS